MKIILFIYIFIVSLFPCFCGELENLEADVDFIYKNFDYVNRQSIEKDYASEYKQRMRSAQMRAYKIQMLLQKLGIINIELQENLAGMIAFSDLERAKKMNGVKGSRWYFYNEIKKQIRILQKLKFSYEQQTFTRLSNSGKGELSAVTEFEKTYKDIAKFSMDKTIYSEAMMKTFKETKINLFLEAGKKIAVYVSKQKKQMPEEYNLSQDLQTFATAYDEKTLEMKKQNFKNRHNSTNTTTYRKPNAKKRVNNMKETAQFRKILERLELSLKRIERDIKMLKQAHIDFPIKGKQYYKPMRQEQSSFEDSLPPQTETSVISRKQTKSELISNYRKLLKEKWESEDKINGVSEDFYKSYASILPPRLRKNMEQKYQALCKENMEPARARKAAVLSVYGKYYNNPSELTKEDLKYISTLKEINHE